jgi:L,D-peptidoglycan transpeptidase YkuD (ErfK/YbiS/YcfS/YnhG family)
VTGRQASSRRARPRRNAAAARLGIVAAACAVTAALVTGCAGSQDGRPRAAAAPASSPGADGTAGPAAAGSAATASAASPGSTRQQVRQLIRVTAAGYGDTWVSLTAYQWSAGGWRRVLGPWPARIGRGGFAPPGGKREGDGRTPSGTFRLQFIFGTGPDPGFRYPYRRSRPRTAWDDDPASPRYNERVDTRRADPGASPEPMDQPAYVYGVAIGYNAARTPGLGSAIFLHASIGIATSGCVTLPIPRLLRVLRWLAPGRSPRIRMGVG